MSPALSPSDLRNEAPNFISSSLPPTSTGHLGCVRGLQVSCRWFIAVLSLTLQPFQGRLETSALDLRSKWFGMDFRGLDRRSGSPDFEYLCQSNVDQVQQRLQQHYKRDEDDPEIQKRNAKALVSTAENLKTRLCAQAAQKFRQSNARAPIHRLPTEILVAILTWALPVSNDPTRYYLRLHVLGQVSYSWWRLILETPSFWAVVSDNLPPDLLDTALKRSLAYPLTIRSLPGAFSSPSLQKVHQHAPRWISLSLYLPSSFKVEEYLDQPSPHLQSLSMRLDSSLPPSVPDGFKLFGGCPMEQLREVTFTSGVIKGAWELLSGARLEKLVLDNLPRLAVSYSQLFGIIESSPRLHTFSLRSISLLHSEPRPGGVRAMDLPLLRRLHISQAPVETTKTVLHGINAPNCLSIRITGLTMTHDMPEDALFLHEPTSYLLTSIMGILQKSQTLKASFFDGAFELVAVPAVVAGHSTGVALFLGIGLASVTRALSWLTEGLGPSGIPCPVDMELIDNGYIYQPTTANATYTHCFALLPDVRSLDLNTTRTMDSLFDFLGQKTVVNGVTTWPLLNLAKLRLNMESSSWDVLLEMLESRYADVDNADAGSHDERTELDGANAESAVSPHTSAAEEILRPVMLASLILEGETEVNEDILEEIYNIIGQDRVSNRTVGPPDSMEDEYHNQYEYGDEEDYFNSMSDIW